MEVKLDSYDYIIVAFSAGKDSIAMVLDLIERGVNLDKLEFWHHEIDGREGSKLKMDWPCTPGYCEAFAAHIGVPLYYTWKQGGFEGEMLREKAYTRPISFECPQPDGSVLLKQSGGTGGKLHTRMKFPQVSADLTVRWCSGLN